jgi:hypothetical protein
LEYSLEEKIRETMENLKLWEASLIKKEEEWNKKFEKALSEHSIDGISNFISQSALRESNFYETSVYKRNE